MIAVGLIAALSLSFGEFMLATYIRKIPAHLVFCLNDFMLSVLSQMLQFNILLLLIEASIAILRHFIIIK